MMMKIPAAIMVLFQGTAAAIGVLVCVPMTNGLIFSDIPGAWIAIMGEQI